MMAFEVKNNEYESERVMMCFARASSLEATSKLSMRFAGFPFCVNRLIEVTLHFLLLCQQLKVSGPWERCLRANKHYLNRFGWIDAISLASLSWSCEPLFCKQLPA